MISVGIFSIANLILSIDSSFPRIVKISKIPGPALIPESASLKGCISFPFPMFNLEAKLFKDYSNFSLVGVSIFSNSEISKVKCSTVSSFQFFCIDFSSYSVGLSKK